MNYSLAQLKSFQSIKSNYNAHQRQNQAYRDLAQKEKQSVLDRADKATKEIDKKIENRFYKKGGLLVHVAALVIALIILLGTFTFFQPTFSFKFENVVEAYDKKVAEDYTILPDIPKRHYEIMNGLTDRYYSPSQIEESTAEYLEWRKNECELLMGGTFILTAIFLLVLQAIIVAKFGSNTNDIAWAPIILAISIFGCFVFGLIFICKGAWNDVHGLFGFIGAILNVILMIITTPFGGFRFIFRAGYVMALPVILICSSILLGYILYFLAHKLVVAINQNKGENDGEIAKLLTKKKAIIANCPKEAEKVYQSIMAKITPNPYKNAFSQIPFDIVNELDQLISVWEKGYARDFVGARLYLQDQRNHKQLMEQRERHHQEDMRRMASIESAIQQETQAIRDAANKTVDVYIYY